MNYKIDIAFNNLVHCFVESFVKVFFSLDKAVQLIGLSNNPDEEIEKIKAEKASQVTANLFEPTM